MFVCISVSEFVLLSDLKVTIQGHFMDSVIIMIE